MKRTPLKRKTALRSKTKAPLKRTPLRSKRATPRRKAPVRCMVARCTKRPTVQVEAGERYCAGHATDLADKLVGDFVKNRDGHRCILRSFNGQPCYQPQQVYWCHMIPKGRYHATRWEPDNAVTGCSAHHMAFDHAPIEKDAWCEAWLGSTRWEQLRTQARGQKAVDVARVIQAYR